MDIGHAIRYLRKQKGWTQQQLADFSHTSKGNISNLENGNQGYSPAILQHLAAAFNCSVSQIFLLAEHLDEKGQLPLDGEVRMPIDILFIQLSPEIQNSLLVLIKQIIQQNKS